GLATTYNNIASIHYARGDYAAALEWYGKSVAIFERLGAKASAATLQKNIEVLKETMRRQP
ncbi:MAG: tetratricopeptide repeat protein, partial [Anaerolineae bacterium]|nr:tetratricopeptide repeat protein [Anaerolineae bacterium]